MVALPSQVLCSQFNHLDDVNILLTALKLMGFDDVMEVGSAAEILSEETKKYIAGHQGLWPVINTACPTVLRLIRVRFPSLIDHLLPFHIPAETAARIARRRAMEKTGLPSEKIGIVYIARDRKNEGFDFLGPAAEGAPEGYINEVRAVYLPPPEVAAAEGEK